MDLNLTPEELQFRDELRAWLAANVPKDWPEHRNEPLQTRFEYMRKWQKTLYDGGWAGLSWPPEYGGRGANLMQQVIFWQEMARADAPPIAGDMGLGMIGPTIIHFGTDEQKKEHLREDSARRQHMEPGFFRARRRLRSCQPEVRSPPGGRPLHREWPEGVDQLWLGGGLVRAAGAHRQDRSQAQGPHRVAAWT